MKRLSLAYLLWFLGGCGVLGLHRFYLNRPSTGVLWLSTLGLAGIGALSDAFRLKGMVEVENLASHLLAQAQRPADPLMHPA